MTGVLTGVKVAIYTAHPLALIAWCLVIGFSWGYVIGGMRASSCAASRHGVASRGVASDAVLVDTVNVHKPPAHLPADRSIVVVGVPK